ncbi:DUF3096 domain-containing protein [Candidatus Microgenomates bacterium]|jgi:uncharacterized membrane protein HdeD (DUF308 family)|nr:MAG: DUF3096 domain-containing protein [Candidatus Microgenomates bacterium]
MRLTLVNLSPILSLVFGVLILFNPRLLSTLVGIYLILIGLIGLGILAF